MAPLAHRSGVGEVVSTLPRTGLPGSLAHPFTEWAFPVKLIGDEGKRCAAYRLLFARRFPKRALSSRRRAVRERVTNRLAPIATLALPSHKGSFVQRGPAKQLQSLLQAQSGDYLRNGLFNNT
jgi:hypothetical protein